MSTDPAAAPPNVPVPSAPLSEVPAWPVGTLRTRGILDAMARRIAETGAAELAASGIHAESTIREGAVGPEIVEEARAWRADLVVLGARRHGLVRRLLLGSVTRYVAEHALCSVELIREAHYE